MGRITDSQGRSIEYFPVDLSAGQESAVIQIMVTREAAHETTLLSNSSSYISAQVRRTGSGDSFADAAAGIDISALALDAPTGYDLKYVAASVVPSRQRPQLDLRIRLCRAAAWRAA